MSSKNVPTHSDMVKALMKDPLEIVKNMTEREAGLIHMVMGISGEAGELLDAIKKHTMYKKELNLKNVIEELGDLEFYMEGVRQLLHLSRDMILQANIDKLAKRYSTGSFSNEQAQERADKKEEE